MVGEADARGIVACASDFLAGDEPGANFDLVDGEFEGGDRALSSFPEALGTAGFVDTARSSPGENGGD